MPFLLPGQITGGLPFGIIFEINVIKVFQNFLCCGFEQHSFYEILQKNLYLLVAESLDNAFV